MSAAIRSPSCVVIATLPVAGMLYWASNHDSSAWYGINSGPLKPLWNGVLNYWIFFAVGWCLFQRPELLKRFDRGWHWRVLCGTAISFALCAYCNNQLLVNGRVQWMYPLIAGEEIRDYSLFKSQLLQAKDHETDDTRKFVWDSMSPEYQRFVEQTDAPDSDQLAGIGMEISLKSFMKPDLADFAKNAELSLSAPWQAMLESPDRIGSAKESLELNRKIVEAAFSPAIVPHYQAPAWVRGVYFFAYGLTSWLLVFGTLGFFNRVITQPSPAARYIADSSYWLYLIHLPIQFQIQLWIAQADMFWLFKYTLYMVLSFAVMVPTYHFLVRSTWLGVFLNGRRYPFVAPRWPLAIGSDREVPATSVPSPHLRSERGEMEGETVDGQVSLADRLATESGEG